MQIALTHPRFGRLLAALAASQLGDWLYNLALLAYVQQRTHSTTWLGLTTAARVAPMVIAGPVGGLISDRFDRRQVMIASDVARAALMGTLVLVAATGSPVALVPLLAAAATLAAVPYPPSVAAVTPRLVSDEELPAANAARATIAPACIAAGPALGAVLLMIGPPSVAFAINAVTFIVSGLLVSSIPATEVFAAAPRPISGVGAGDPAPLSAAVAELRAGALALIRVPEAARIVSADAAASFVYGSQTVLLLLVAGRLGLGAAGYGYLLAGQGLGGIVGACIAGRLRGRGSRRSTLAAALLLVALPLPVLALTTSVLVAIVVVLAGGAGAVVVEVVADTRLQRALDEERLGCAYGFAFAASLGAIAAGALVAPVLVAVAGPTGALIVVGIAVVALAGLIGARAGAAQPVAVAGAEA